MFIKPIVFEVVVVVVVLKTVKRHGFLSGIFTFFLAYELLTGYIFP